MKRATAWLLVSGLLMMVPSYGLADGTGGPSLEWVQKQAVSHQEDQAQIEAHMRMLKDRVQAKRQGEIGTQGYMDQPPAAYYIPSSNIAQWPVITDSGSNDSRYCVHCGPATTLIALRSLARTGQLAVSDLASIDDRNALYKLGQGYLNRPNAAYAILVRNSDGTWGGSQWRMLSNLNARLKSGISYILSDSQSWSNASSLSNSLKYAVYADKPVILLVRTGGFLYYRGDNLSHFVVMDGYSGYGKNHRINDPNNCSKNAVKNRYFGYHSVSESETWRALSGFGRSNVLW